MEISRPDARMSACQSSPGRSGARRRQSAAVLLLALIALGAGAGNAFAAGFEPIVKTQPASVVVEEGHPATFESTASGLPTPTVQWESSIDGGKTWKAVAKATTTVLTIAKPKNAETGTQFRAHFKNSSGEAFSEAATMTVASAPVVTKSPVSKTVNEGTTAIFEATGTGFPSPSIQWELSTDAGATWNAIPFETSSTLFLIGTKSSQNGNRYRARFTNVAGSVVSAAATLTVQSVAVVTLQPEDVTVLVNGNASFESTAKGFPNPTEQWEVSTNGGTSWANVPGATASVLTISAAQLTQNHNEYRASFTNAAGTSHSEAATLYVSATNYSAFGWGMNNHGEAGVGSTESSITSPLPIKGMTFVTAVSSGLRHSLALLAGGTVDSWGFNSHGQLGDFEVGSTRSPIPVEHLKNVTAVAAGGSHSLALLSNGTVMAWGNDESGQLGNGHNTDSQVPVPVEGLTGVTAIAAGDEHSLALLSDGTVMSWGNGERGQLGTGGKANHNSPIAVKGLSGVTAIAAGGQYSLALLSNGTVVSWGDDSHGQLGNMAILEEVTEATEEEGVYSTSPIPVDGLSGVTSIAAGRTHDLALLSNGTVEAWGNDSEGEVGNATMTPQVDTATPVTGLTGVTAISAGDQESVALLSSGSLEAWGTNSSGDLGIGAIGEDSSVPVMVHSISGAAGVAAGGTHMIAFGASLPAVTAVTPHNGPVAGGASVTISGSGIGNATAVHFGAAAATGLTINSSSSVTVTSPAGSGTVDVTVTTPSGTSPVNPGDRYTYQPAPTVLKLSAKGGPAAGGTVITITGTELMGATEVDFGTVPASTFTVNNNSTITVTAPANAGGTTDVRVKTLSGTSAITTKDHFKYTPGVEAVSPANGPIAGGLSVTVTGTGFIPGNSGTAFKVGKGKVTSVECASMTTCTIVVPAAKTAGTVDVQATVGKVKSAIAAGDHFTYE